MEKEINKFTTESRSTRRNTEKKNGEEKKKIEPIVLKYNNKLYIFNYYIFILIATISCA